MTYIPTMTLCRQLDIDQSVIVTEIDSNSLSSILYKLAPKKFHQQRVILTEPKRPASAEAKIITRII